MRGCGSWNNLQSGLDAAAAALGGATQLMLLLIRFTFRLSAEADEVLRSHLSPQVTDTAVPSSKDEHEVRHKAAVPEIDGCHSRLPSSMQFPLVHFM